MFYRNKKYRGIVLIVQPTIFCLGWDKDVPQIGVYRETNFLSEGGRFVLSQ